MFAREDIPVLLLVLGAIGAGRFVGMDGAVLVILGVLPVDH